MCRGRCPNTITPLLPYYNIRTIIYKYLVTIDAQSSIPNLFQNCINIVCVLYLKSHNFEKIPGWHWCAQTPLKCAQTPTKRLVTE